MLPKEIVRLVEEVFGFFGEDEQEEAKKEPEVYLASLLSKIKEDLPDVSAVLKLTTEEALFEDNLNEAREKLNPKKEGRSRKTLAKSR